MADVAKQIDQHLRSRSEAEVEPSFAKCLTVADKFVAHGMGIVIEELMSKAELAEYRQRAH